MAPDYSLVRPARPADAAALRRLQSLLIEPSPELLSTALAERSESLPIRTATLLVSPTADDRPVGYLLAVGSDPTHVAELAVDPRFRREGRARALLATACGDADAVTVHVAADNEPARSLYEEFGFVETGRSADRFDGSDCLTLRYCPGSDQSEE
ncbi:GNAT family N-acetyltransferase [Halohasta salina]|uniref:GNAT family N-acetyltransferase n=1 Tax=Halohasta salina TaxID=2961621 RepID=UPI0020A55A36|nr:N-acetyltransferase [Halohasta salina]